jgi:hypothetical protein
LDDPIDLSSHSFVGMARTVATFAGAGRDSYANNERRQRFPYSNGAGQYYEIMEMARRKVAVYAAGSLELIARFHCGT